jgi:hypothetical protein
LIKRYESPVGTKLFENRPAVAAAAKGGVDVGPVGTEVKKVKAFGE